MISSRDGSVRLFLFLLFLLLFPLLVAIIWGPHFEDTAYISLRYAQNLAAGRGLGFDAGVDLPHSALAIGLLALLELLAPLTQISLYLSALGWGVAAVTLYLTLRSNNSTVAGLAATLLVFSPIVSYTLASPISWAVAIGWLTIIFAVRSQGGRPFIVSSLLLLAIWFDLSVFLLIGLLFFWRWQHGQRIQKIGLLLVLILSLIWVGYLVLQFGRPIVLYPLIRLQDIYQPIQSNELTWLFLPFLFLGLLVSVISRYFPRIKVPAVGLQFDRDLILFASFTLIWALIASLFGSALAPAVVTLAVIYLVALGLAWCQAWIARRSSPSTARTLTLAMAGLLVLIQLSVTGGNYLARPLEQYALEDEVVDWLKQESEPGDTLYTSRRMGFLADRPTSQADPRSRQPEQLAKLFDTLSNSFPEYLIAGSDKDWMAFNGSGWLENRYQSIARFASDYARQDALTVWAYKPTIFDEGLRHPADVIIGDSLSLIAYQYEPSALEPGDDIYLTLYLEPTQPITVGVSTDIHLRYMQDGHIWAFEQRLTPSTVSGHYWQPGQVLAERIKLRTEENIPPGAYELQALWRWPDRDDESWSLYQEDDPNPLDRIRLGYVIVPPPVDTNLMEPVEATFGDQIRLSGINISPEQKPGDELALSLFWEALRAPDDSYTVFVHLFNAAGDLVTSHDGEPADGTYPTAAWQPGPLVQDTHRLNLPADLPAGEYNLRIGLYLLETGERLPVTGAEGEAYPDHTLPLTSLEIGN